MLVDSQYKRVDQPLILHNYIKLAIHPEGGLDSLDCFEDVSKLLFLLNIFSVVKENCLHF